MCRSVAPTVVLNSAAELVAFVECYPDLTLFLPRHSPALDEPH